MSTATIDERKYEQLLRRILPVVIRDEKEYQRMLAAVAELMEKDESEISPEEGRALELLSMLVEEYEDRAHPLPKPKPGKMLASLLQERGMKPSDLWQVLPKSRVSEILSGKRGISKAQAKALAEFFRLPVQVFFMRRAYDGELWKVECH